MCHDFASHREDDGSNRPATSGSVIRVALVTPKFPPEIGGIEAYVSNLAVELAALDHQVDVLTQCPRGCADTWAEFDASPGVRILRFPDWTGTRGFRVSPGLWRYLHRRGRDYDIIHAHNYGAFPALASALATDQRFVFTPHYHGIGHTTAAKLLHLPYDRLAKRIFLRALYILCVSDAEVDLWKQDFPDFSAHVHKVGIGVDVLGIQKAIPFERDRPLMLVMGRLEAYKHIERAIEAFAVSGADADMVIIGTGSQKEGIVGLVDKLGVASRVQMIDYVDDGDARRWQRTARVVMSLSAAEAFGLTVAEAAAAGARIRCQ